jgi:hypothetical protein
VRGVFLACLVAVAAAAPAAHAYVAPGATIVSASLERLGQADDATLSVAISGDGRYVAFQARARNFFADDDPDPPGRLFLRDRAGRSTRLLTRDRTTGDPAGGADAAAVRSPGPSRSASPRRSGADSRSGRGSCQRSSAA